MSVAEQPNGTPVKPGTPPVEVKNHFVLVLDLNLDTNAITVQGGIQNIGLCYQTIEMAKDAIRKWNELNNNYLKAEPMPKKPFLGGGFGKKH